MKRKKADAKAARGNNMETTAKPTEVKAEDPIVGLTRRLAMLETIVYRLTEHQHGATGQLYIPFEKL